MIGRLRWAALPIHVRFERVALVEFRPVKVRYVFELGGRDYL
jgi:hypothetical protein